MALVRASANVTVSNGSVTGYDQVGGVIGTLEGSDGASNGNTFLNVHNVNTAVTGLLDKTKEGDGITGVGIGGIVGYEKGSSSSSNNIFCNVSNSGHVTGRSYVGGLAGRLVTADMDQVRNTGRVEQQTAETTKKASWGTFTTLEDSFFIGGIAGAIGPDDAPAGHVQIRRAYNGGTIGVDTSKADYYPWGEYIGGIVGMLSGYHQEEDPDNTHPCGAQDTVIDYAHNTGTITAGYKNVGGIVGFTTGLGKDHDGNASDVIIRHSYND